MASTSVSGLVSGLDTSTIISQLMQLEAKPQTTLKTRVSTEQKVVTALQALNTKLAGIAAKAAELGRTTSWSPAKATSDNPLVTVKTTTGATPGSFALDVTGLATSATSTYARTGTLGRPSRPRAPSTRSPSPTRPAPRSPSRSVTARCARWRTPSTPRPPG